ncbi:probable 2-ketogluconate reductase isoform X2 [Protopterus annectens]|uniref:probable 2-ketogluconate reductase isoform X2 n=1 Tax=Protopterus annectens TaxID=7888 RepID=UPI001CFAC553|nr:probable 2-ketogluconate reductase isoform X2 [Protopterus annectens]
MAAFLKHSLLLNFRSQTHIVLQCHLSCQAGLFVCYQRLFCKKANASPPISVCSRKSYTGENKNVMEKPYLLLNCEKGGIHGIHVKLAAILEEHFEVIPYDEFLKNKNFYSHKIKIFYLWTYANAPKHSLLLCLPNLKIVLSPGAGLDHLDLPLISSYGVKVANTPLTVSSATADFGMALLLASARSLIEGVKMAALPDIRYITFNWMGVDITGATLGIIGMGKIGYKIAQRAKGFEMKILYHNRKRRSKEDENAVGAKYCEKMEDLLQQSDFVMLVVNLTPETTKLIGKHELKLMKPTATLINICRGQVVDQDALVEALQNGVIRAAALDVTYPEPLPRDHPLLKLQNVIVTAHIGARTYSTNKKVVERMLANGLAALAGLPIPDEVTQSQKKSSN